MTQTFTAQQIRNAKPEGKMSMVSGVEHIVFDNGVTFECQSSREKQILWNKLKRMGFEQHYNFDRDEDAGIAEAARNGENPFAFTILSR